MKMHEELTEYVVQVGEDMATDLLDATIRESVGGDIGGCEFLDLSDYREEFRDLIQEYLDEDITCTTAVYLAMRRAIASGNSRSPDGMG